MIAALRRLSRSPRPRAAILRYHRVTALACDPHGLATPPARFERHLELLRSSFHPIGLTQLLDSLRRGQLPRAAVAVTFDDGYADNLYEAGPLLERAGVPATLFVVSSALSGEGEFWWDALERILLAPGRLPERLVLRAGAFAFERCLGEDEICLPAEPAPHASAWTLADATDPTPRHALFRELWRALRRLAPELQAALTRELADWASVSTAARPSHRRLSRDEVAQAAREGVFEIGSHGHRHAALSRLDAAEREMEIAGSKSALERLVGAPVRHFAYPYGSGLAAARQIRRAGFASACTTRAGAVSERSDPHRLPRIHAGEVDEAELARQLEGLS